MFNTFEDFLDFFKSLDEASRQEMIHHQIIDTGNLALDHDIETFLEMYNWSEEGYEE